MAYLRGESYVDGNLIVEGALKVSKLQTADGNLPALASNGYTKDYLVMFTDGKGTIGNSKIYTSTAASVIPDVDDSHYLYLNYYSSNMKVVNKNITLNEKTMTWGSV